MKVNLRIISGNWTVGYALDKHVLNSEFIGNNESGYPMFDTTRSEVGEAVYQLKYKQNWEQVEPLADALVANAAPNFGPIDLVVPVPPTTRRSRQPVFEISRAVAGKLGVSSFEGIVTKNSPKAGAVPLKELHTKVEKVAALKGLLQLKDEIQGEGRWNVLVVDDLYHTGASMEAVCEILGSYRKIGDIYVAALTWK